MDKQNDLISRLQDEADLCRNDGASDIAAMLDEATEALREAAAELERHKPLMQAVEWILDDGHMNQEHLARLRAAWEAV